MASPLISMLLLLPFLAFGGVHRTAPGSDGHPVNPSVAIFRSSTIVST